MPSPDALALARTDQPADNPVGDEQLRVTARDVQLLTEKPLSRQEVGGGHWRQIVGPARTRTDAQSGSTTTRR